jgi:serine/threonine-protein kinase
MGMEALMDRYDLEAVVGSGSTAHVFRARDLRYDRTVAVKVLRRECTDAVGTRRFLEELATSLHLEDPGIVQVFDTGEADGVLFYVMPFYEDAESLEDRLGRSGALPLADALRIVRDVGDALSFAHEHGVIHRDVKPGNILLVGGRALLTDFGIARVLSAAAVTRLTARGLSIGTPAYMSPEQVAADGESGPPSDQYGLACVLHEMLAGRPLFDGASTSAVARKHLALDPPRLGELCPDIPRGIERAVLRALAKSPDERFPSVAAFLQALDEATESQAGSLVFGVRPEALARVAAVLITAILIGGLLLWMWSAAPPR